jgi:phage FluMu gp28-like protein
MSAAVQSTPQGNIVKLTKAQREKIKRSMDDAGFSPREYAQKFLGDKSRFRRARWSRQTGKTTNIAQDNVLTAGRTNRDVMNLSASADQTKELMLRVAVFAEIFHGVAGEIQREILAGTLDETLYVDDDKVRITQTTVALPGGQRMIGRPANPRTARGFSMHTRLDEFSMHHDQKAIWQAAFPSITSNEALTLVVSGTPNGKGDKFFDICTAPSTEEGGIWSDHTVTIYDAVAQGLNVDPEVLHELAGDEDTWRQEYLVEFIDEATAFLTYDMISACQHEGLKVIHRLEPVKVDGKDVLDYDLATLLPIESLTGGSLYMGIDIGRRRDLTVLWIWEIVGNIAWTRAQIELSKVPFRIQEKMAHDLIGGYEIRRTCVDETGIGMMLAEGLKTDFGEARVEPLSFTEAVKQQLAEGMRPKFEDRLCRIPIDKKVREDLHGITKLTTAGGHVRYLGERSGKAGVIHPDRFWAAALGLHAAEAPPVTQFVMGQTAFTLPRLSEGVMI